MPSRVTVCAALLVSLCLFAPLAADEAVSSDDAALLERGRAVYAQSCLDCHGEGGVGVPGVYDLSLTGDKSVKELGGYIAHAMPEGSPEDVAGDDAVAVARFIYDSFYSPLAQERIRPARLSAARLTSRQFEYALADLISDPSWIYPDVDPWRIGGGKPEQAGIEISYIDGNDWKSRIVSRADRIALDFGPEGPKLPEGSKPLQDDVVRVNYDGSLVTPATGRYDLVVESNCAFELQVNTETLFNVRTRSEDQTRHERSVRLLGGRAYRLKIETRMPVVANRKKDEKQPVHSDTSSGDDERFYFRLKWVPPHDVERLVPTRSLTLHKAPPQFVFSRDMPADDKSTGYVQAGDISQQWVESAIQAAMEIGEFSAAQLREITGAREEDPKRIDKATQFITGAAERGWRRPLGDQREAFETAFRELAESDGVEEAVRRTMLRIVASPRMLYREINFGEMDDYDVASWLSFTLYDSLPTPQMLQLAKQKKLRDPGTLNWVVPSVLADLRAKAKMRAFAHSWLHADQFGDLAKNPERFPEFTDELEADLRTSLDLFLDDVFWGENPDFGRLMTSTEMWVNRPLAEMYAGQGESEGGFDDDTEWAKVWMGEGQRAGLLTHPYLMAGFSYDAETSPVHRGVFLSRSILGRLLKPPPIAVAPTAPELAPHLSQRERVAKQTEAIACQTCHGMINPLGFSLEHFDPLGRRRDKLDVGPIDASGRYITRSGEEIAFADVTELAAWIAGSREAREAFVEQVFQFFVNQPVRAFGPDTLDHLTDAFETSGGNIKELLTECVKLSAQRTQELSSSDKVAAN